MQKKYVINFSFLLYNSTYSFLFYRIITNKQPTTNQHFVQNYYQTFILYNDTKMKLHWSSSFFEFISKFIVQYFSHSYTMYRRVLHSATHGHSSLILSTVIQFFDCLFDCAAKSGFFQFFYIFSL